MFITPNKTTNIIKFVTIVMISCVCFTSFAKQVDKESKKISVKCHVELLGGGETIYFALINKKRLANFKEQLGNKLITTTWSDKKQKVYKATECVLLKGSFKGNRAKATDLKIAR